MEKKVANGTILFGNGNQIKEMWHRMEEAKASISKLNGVLKVEANHVTHMFYVEYDPETIGFERIRKQVKSYAR